MIRNKSIDILNSLHKEEFKLLGKFINSPFHNSNKKIVKLYSILSKYYPDFTRDDFNKNELFKRVFPEEIYNENKFKELFSDMLQVAQEFLIQIRFNKEVNEKQLTLLKELHVRNLGNVFSANSKKLRERLKNDKIDMNTFSSLEKIDYLIAQQQMQTGNFDTVTTYIENFTEYSVTVFIIKAAIYLQNSAAMNYAVNTNNVDNLINTVINEFDFRKILPKIRDGKAQKLCEIYIYLIDVHKRKEPEYYFKLKNKFFEHINLLNEKEMLELFICLTNLSFMFTFDYEEIFRRETFELYKEMIRRNVFLDDGTDYLLLNMFRNIIQGAIAVNELEWAENFLKTHIDKLIPELRENAYNYSTALIQFKKKNFSDALFFASKVKFQDVSEKRTLRILMLKIYYELNYIEEFLSLCDAFRHFLNANKLIGNDFKTQDIRLINQSTRLFKIKNQLETNNLDIILIEIKNESNITAKNWLLEKIQELKTSKEKKNKIEIKCGFI